MSGCKQATSIWRGGLTATAEQQFYSVGATRRIVLRVAVVYFLVTFFSTVPAEGLSLPSWAQNNCNKTEYFDHGTAHCESCCDICCFAKIKGTAETCGRECPEYSAKLLRDSVQREEQNSVKKGGLIGQSTNGNPQLPPAAMAGIIAAVVVCGLALAGLVFVKRKAIFRTCKREPEENPDPEAATPLQTPREASPAAQAALAVSTQVADAGTYTGRQEEGRFGSGPGAPVQVTEEGRRGAEETTLKAPQCHFYDSDPGDTQRKDFVLSETEDSSGCGASGN
ncbi:uncharacterized protein [Littorina saxatilis]|uniref:Uncharacterized protein n=1 Tax=Littorina saxatilis TaxID=31220 RepID=A0AAN9BWT1_9CAEN